MYLFSRAGTRLHIHVIIFLLQASSDLSIVDFDIPFSIIFVAAASIELLGTIGIMAAVTWQVLIVAILAVVGGKYVQVYRSNIQTLVFLNFYLQ